MATIDNVEIPSLLLAEQGSAPTTPASGFGRLYAKATGLFFKDDAGTETGPLGTGGGGGGTLVSIDDPAVFTAAYGATLGYDEEFDDVGSTLPTGWSWVNQGTATYAERGGGGVVQHQGVAASGNDVKLLNRAIPSEAAFTIQAKVGCLLRDENWNGFGLALRDSASGKLIALGALAGVGFRHFRVDDFTNPTTYSASGADVSLTTHVQYIRIQKVSATSWNVAISSNGIGWLTIATGVNPQTFLGTAPTHVGFYINAATGAGEVNEVACEWFRVR